MARSELKPFLLAESTQADPGSPRLKQNRSVGVWLDASTRARRSETACVRKGAIMTHDPAGCQ